MARKKSPPAPDGKLQREIAALGLSALTLFLFLSLLPVGWMGAFGEVISSDGNIFGRIGAALARSVWSFLGIAAVALTTQLTTFLVNGGLFVLVGMQIPRAVQNVTSVSLGRAVVIALVVAGVLVLVRMLWLHLIAAVARLDRRESQLARRVSAIWMISERVRCRPHEIGRLFCAPAEGVSTTVIKDGTHVLTHTTDATGMIPFTPTETGTYRVELRSTNQTVMHTVGVGVCLEHGFVTAEDRIIEYPGVDIPEPPSVSTTWPRPPRHLVRRTMPRASRRCSRAPRR